MAQLDPDFKQFPDQRLQKVAQTLISQYPNYKYAISLLQEYLYEFPGDSEAQDLLAECFEQAEKQKEVRKLLKAYKTTYLEGKDDSGKRFYHQVIQLDPAFELSRQWDEIQEQFSGQSIGIESPPSADSYIEESPPEVDFFAPHEVISILESYYQSKAFNFFYEVLNQWIKEDPENFHYLKRQELQRSLLRLNKYISDLEFIESHLIELLEDLGHPKNLEKPINSEAILKQVAPEDQNRFKRMFTKMEYLNREIEHICSDQLKRIK